MVVKTDVDPTLCFWKTTRCLGKNISVNVYRTRLPPTHCLFTIPYRYRKFLARNGNSQQFT